MKESPVKSLKNVKLQTRKRDNYRLSVAVRIKNESKGLPYFLKSLREQSIYDSLEIVFLDSGSTDSTIDLLKDVDCSLYQIAPEEFSFGSSCNMMMELTSSDFICFFSGHVILANPDILEKAYKFLEDKKGSGYFRQIPNEIFGYSLYDKVFLKYRFKKYRRDAPKRVSAKNHSFSNAASIIYRSHWDFVKFDDVVYGEDEIWADEQLKLGADVFYFHNLEIQHSHKDTCDDVYRRVKMAATVKYPKGVSTSRFIYIYLKIFLALFVSSLKMKTAMKFAAAHANAYKSNKVS